jgi:hypothetical protein
MIRRMLLTSTFVLVVLSWVYPSHAESPLYDGPILIDSIIVHVMLDEDAQVEAKYILVNSIKETAQVSLSHSDNSAELTVRDSPIQDPLIFRPGESKTITLRITTGIEGENLRSFSFNPSVLLDGKRHSQVVNFYTTTVVLPEGVERFISETQTNVHREIDETGRAVYTWEYFSLYPTTFHLMWSAMDVELQLLKQVQPARITKPDQVLTIFVTVENHGDQVVNNISLVDDFDPTEFEAIQPVGEFIHSESSDSEPHFYWRVDIDQLERGEVKSYEYEVRYIGDVSMIHNFTIKPCVARVDGNMVSISNPVSLSKLVGAVKVFPEIEAPQEIVETPSILPLVIVGGALGIALIFIGLYMAWRRR